MKKFINDNFLYVSYTFSLDSDTSKFPTLAVIALNICDINDDTAFNITL